MSISHKSSLIAGEVLTHVHLGAVLYTETCRAMEQRDGTPSTLFIEIDKEIKEVSLCLVSRRTKGGFVIRLI